MNTHASIETSTVGGTDVIEKSITLAAPPGRVWKAISDPREFGRWFGVELLDPFVPGQKVRAAWKPFSADTMAGIAAKIGLSASDLAMPAADATFCTIRTIEPEHTFSFHWVPFGLEKNIANDEKPTLVEFHVEAHGEGTKLTVRESGFDQIPSYRRARAFQMNTGGWAAQLQNVQKHVEGA